MPTIGRYRYRRRADIDVAALDTWQEFALLHPRRNPSPMGLAATFGSDWEATVPELWEIHGGRLTAEAAAESMSKYGTISRPAFWWAFDAPEEERRVIHPGPPDQEARWRADATWFGRFAPSGNTYHKGGWWLESEAKYLCRHGLLTPEEIAFLEARP